MKRARRHTGGCDQSTGPASDCRCWCHNHPKAPRATWRSTDQKYAMAEGWCVILADGTHEEIQRDDDQKTFRSDDDAKRHVRRCANAGSRLHARALAYVRGAR